MNLTGVSRMPAEPVLPSQAILGEGPLWDMEQEVLWWTDIEARQIHRFHPSTGENRSFDIGQRVGTIVCRKRGGLMLAADNGFLAFNPATLSAKLIADPESELAENRFNDGKCDPAGRFWAGTMNLSPFDHRTGSLYSLDSRHQVTKHLSNIGVSNGIVWTSDANTMYYIDTLTGSVDAFDYDQATGGITNRREIFFVPPELGSADGMAIDSQDKIWVAFWGGWCVARIDPDTGQIMTLVELPASNVTACAFGGARLDTLFITTACLGLDAAARNDQPLAGNLFAVSPGVCGTVSNLFCG